MAHTPSPDVAEVVFPAGHPYAAEVEAEHGGWHQVERLVRALTPDECVEPGYYRDPDWTVRDVVAHLGTWLAEAQQQFERITAGTYEGHDIDVDGMNATFLTAMQGQPWDVSWVQANAARRRLLEEWWAIRALDDEAAWWIRKCGGDHYAEHVARLEEWVGELVARRGTEGT